MTVTDRIERPTTEEDLKDFATLVAGLVQEHYKQFPSLKAPVIEVMMGQRYARIVSNDGTQRMAYGFVEIATGNIHKTDGWKRPAHQVRGNIFQPNPLDCCTPYGIVYYQPGRHRRS